MTRGVSTFGDGGGGEEGNCCGFLILGDPTLFIANTPRHLCRIELEERLRLKSESGSRRKTLGILTKKGRTQQGQPSRFRDRERVR